MTLNFYTADKMSSKSVTALIYGKPGNGKTYTIGQLKGKTVVLDIDKTSGTLAGKKGILIIDIDVKNIIDEMNEAIKWLTENTDKYDNIAIDNVSELQSCMLAAYGARGRNEGVPSQGDYQKYQFALMNVLRAFKGLNKTILLTAWEELVTITSPSGEQFTMYMPKIQKGIRDNVCGLCDIVGHIDFNDKKERMIQLQTTQNIYAKNQVDERKECIQSELIINDNKEEK